MTLNKVNYIAEETVITAKNLNDIQDAIITLESTSTKGPKGDKGDKGDPGEQGPIGPQGPAGKDGTSVNIKGSVANAGSLSSIQEGAAVGDGYITEDDGHLHVYNGTSFIDVGEIRGPQGVAGPKGDKGDKGETGAIGPVGPKGEAGLTGPAGAKGPKGDTGAQGLQGPAGPAGPRGERGPQGPAGLTKVYRYVPSGISDESVYITANAEGITGSKTGSAITLVPGDNQIFSIQIRYTSEETNASCSVKHGMAKGYNGSFIVPHIQAITDQEGTRAFKTGVSATFNTAADQIDFTGLNSEHPCIVNVRLI